MKAQVNNPGKAARNINSENNARQQRRSHRGRDVSSRYLYPMVSSATASPLKNNNNNNNNNTNKMSEMSEMSECLSSSPPPPPLRRSNSPNTNSHRKLKNGGISAADRVRSASAERWRPADASKSDSAKASSNGNGARHPMRGLWPNSFSSTPDGMSTLAGQLGSEKLKIIGGGNGERTPAPLRKSDPSFRRASIDPRRRPSNGGNHRRRDENTPSFDNRIGIGLPSAGRKPQMQGSPFVKSTESLSTTKGGKTTMNRTSLRLEPRTSKSANGDPAGYLHRPQAIVHARLSADGFGRQDADTATSEDRSDYGTGFSASRRDTRKGNYVPARFLQDTLKRIRRLSDAGLKQQPLLRKSGGSSADGGIAASFSSNSSDGCNSSLTSSPDRFPVPSTALPPPASAPAYVLAKSSHIPRGLQTSSTKPKPNPAGCATNALNCGIQVFKDKKATGGHEEKAHRLRMLHNRWLQWRFVNARAHAAHEAQIVSAQEVLCNACTTTSELRASVAAKRVQLQKARLKLKLTAVLAAHAVQLEDWVTLEKEHALAITGAMECLDAAIVRIPLVGGAKADAPSLKQALDFAADLMNGIAGAATKLFSEAEKVARLLPELAETVCKERALLEECMELLTTVASLEDEERCLRICLIQLRQIKSQPQSSGVSDSI